MRDAIKAPQEYPNWKPFKGKHEIKYIEDTNERRRKRWSRRKTLWQKSYELATICGGKIFMLFVDDNNQGWVYSSNEELYERYKTTGLWEEQDDFRYNEDNRRIDNRHHSTNPHNRNIPNSSTNSNSCNNSTNRVDGRLAVPTPTKGSPLEMSFAREVAALDLENSDTSVPVLPSDFENLEFRDRISTPRVVQISAVPMCDPNVSCITANQTQPFQELPTAPQNAPVYHQMRTFPNSAQRQLRFNNQIAAAQPVQQYLEQTTVAQLLQQYPQQSAAALPTEQYLQPTVAAQPTEQYLQPTVAAQPTEQYLQPTVAAQPTEQYLQPTVAAQPTEQYLQSTVAALPTEQYLQPTVAAQPTERYPQQTAAAQLTAQYPQQSATAQQTEKSPQQLVSPLPVWSQQQLNLIPETQMNKPFPQPKILAPLPGVQMNKENLAPVSEPQMENMSVQPDQATSKPPTSGKNVNNFYAKEPKKPLKKKSIPAPKASSSRQRTRSKGLRSSPYNKVMASVMSSRKAKKGKTEI